MLLLFFRLAMRLMRLVFHDGGVSNVQSTRTVRKPECDNLRLSVWGVLLPAKKKFKTDILSELIDSTEVGTGGTPQIVPLYRPSAGPLALGEGRRGSGWWA